MRFRECAIGLGLAVGVAFAVPANAATVLDIQGEVLVSTGTGFQIVNGPTTVAAGHQVFVRPGGSAHILFDDGCRVPVKIDAVVQVEENSPCKTADVKDGKLSSSTMLIGGLVIAGGAGLAIGLSGGSSDKNRPASP
jgi:hypothetical protein